MKLIVTCSALAFMLLGRSVAAQSVEGAWKLESVTVAGGANAGTRSGDQIRPSLLIFTKGHYTYLAVGGTTPRSTFDESTPPEERLRSLLQFRSNGGTYELRGSTLIKRHQIALNPNYMTEVVEDEFRIEDDVLWTTRTNRAGTVTTTRMFRRLE